MSTRIRPRPVHRTGRTGLSLLLAAAVALGVTGLTAPAHAADPTTGTGTAPAPRPSTATPALVDGLADPADASVPAATAARAHLAGHKDRYRIPAPDRDLATDTVTTGPDGTETVRLGQKYRGIPVLGAQYLVRMTHKDGKRTVTGTSGTYFTALDLDTTRPTLPAPTAVQNAVRQVREELAKGGYRPAHAKSAKDGLTGTDRGLTVLPTGKGVLARHVTVRGTDPATGSPVVQEVYVDAATGVLRFEAGALRTLTAAAPATGTAGNGTSTRAATPAAAPAGSTGVTGSGVLLHGATVPLNLTKDAAGGRYLLRDSAHMADSKSHNVIQTWDASSLWWMDLDGQWPEGVVPFAMPTPKAPQELTDNGAVDAHWAAGKVYEFYRGTFERDSLDGKGMAINSLVGVTADLGYPWVNAFWDGSKMVYGTGDDEYRSLASDLDVVGHEMTHGVVEHTADLVYAGQSGAMNEAIADYLGNAIDVTVGRTPMTDPDAGLIGGDLCRTLTPKECAFRDLNDGADTGDFISMPLGSRNDQGGVHLNSHIFGGALWDIRESLGGELADRIVYKALTSYITPLDGFTEGRDAVIAAARSLHVKGDRMAKVKKAFDAHGIVPGWEKDLGLDSDVLLGRLGTLETGLANDIGPATGGGWWAVPRSSADSAAPYSVWTGSLDGKGKARQVSPEDGRYHLSPVTDGRRVVWLAVGDTYDLMSAPVAGGPAKRLYSTSSASIGSLSMDGGTVAWSENDGQGHANLRYIEGSDPAPRTVPLNRPDATADDADVRAESPSVHDGRIAYTVSGWWGDDPGHRRAVVDVFDTRTGRTALGTPGRAVWTSRPVATSSGVYWLADEDPFDEGQSAVRRSGLDGSGTTDVIPATSSATIGAWALTASDTAVTLTVDPPAPTGLPYLATQLRQYSSKGAPLGRVSCAPGRQTYAVAAGGGRVLWLDTTTTSFDLVTRSRPAGDCG
ncbi:M4 family metallopeptidase [Actinacidiphila glaucinigra]|uniref:M4 family metallopeptidase n=1 Tax=Actinacidiphila glaucinigra TaxID=235986 RepID=UPI002DD9AFC5|nr:M4 family metallopeptidase [Actinacidiphila glaucinigra]WSD64430.1 M4 family metallopeptidase [Actinacidiphila glaucinigra]